MEISWVETPHIGGILKVARLSGSGRSLKIEILASLEGFSNHAIGSREMQEALAFDWNGDKNPEIILPGADRTTLKVVSFKEGKLKVIEEMEIGGVISSPLIAADLDGDGKGEVLLVTKDAKLLSFSP